MTQTYSKLNRMCRIYDLFALYVCYLQSVAVWWHIYTPMFSACHIYASLPFATLLALIHSNVVDFFSYFVCQGFAFFRCDQGFVGTVQKTCLFR